MRYFIEFSYSGKNYFGYQIQPNEISVQEVLEKALSTILREKIKTTGAGRTDTGVHAKKIFAHFDTERRIWFISSTVFCHKILQFTEFFWLKMIFMRVLMRLTERMNIIFLWIKILFCRIHLGKCGKGNWILIWWMKLAKSFSSMKISQVFKNYTRKIEPIIAKFTKRFGSKTVLN